MRGWATAAVWLALSVSSHSVRSAHAQGDGRRAVNVERYGISTRAPQAWRLIEWAHDNKAFVLRLPQDSESRVGYVSCELGIAPESLDDYRKRMTESDERPPAEPSGKRQLTRNQLEPLDPNRYGAKLTEQLQHRLVSQWDIIEENGTRWYEQAIRVVFDGTLYTFRLTTDEAHFDAYRLDFDEMFAAVKLTPPETGLRRMPGGYWMQRDYRFALQLPAGWRPAFGPNDKALFFATGERHELFTDNLLVLATRVRQLDLDQLKESIPAEVAKTDPKATVTCQVVRQGGTEAIESVVHTRRGTFELTIIERRFSSTTRTYEVKFTCLREEFEQRQADFRRALDSFVEVVEEPKRNDT